jgi:hypothetical protein
VTTPKRVPDTVFDRIGSYLPAEQRESFYRYVLHLRTLDAGDSLLTLAEGMALFTCISRQVPEALAVEREKLIAEFARLCTKHESATTNATNDVRTMFAAHQKLLEQNMAAWQNKEQRAAQSLDRMAKRFEDSAEQCATRLQTACGKFENATEAHHAAAMKAQQWVALVSLENKVWPYLACASTGALLALIAAHFLRT